MRKGDPGPESFALAAAAMPQSLTSGCRDGSSMILDGRDDRARVGRSILVRGVLQPTGDAAPPTRIGRG
jgi:hypothetical protein